MGHHVLDEQSGILIFKHDFIEIVLCNLHRVPPYSNPYPQLLSMIYKSHILK